MRHWSVPRAIPGRVERVFVDQGDFVHKGQIIATLEDTDIRREFERAQAGLDAARPNEQAARAAVQGRRATEWETQRDWQREKRLVESGAVSQEEVDQYKEQYTTAASAVRAAQADVLAAQHEVASAEAEVRFEQFSLSETRIFTYVSGVITNLPKRPGDAIVPGEPVAPVADPSLTMVDAYVDQRFSGKISAGQPAMVVLRGRGDEPLRGRVYRVSPKADPATEEMTVEVSFPLPAKLLEIGQWADVYIRVGEAKHALAVPNTAVMPMRNKRMVFVVGFNRKVRPVRVRVIASSPRLPIVAVKGNLAAGELVVVKPMMIKPGERVSVAQVPAPGLLSSNRQRAPVAMP